MPGLTITEAHESDEYYEYVVRVDAPLGAPRSAKTTASRIKALEAAGVVDVPQRVFYQIQDVLSLRNPLSEDNFEAPWQLVEVVSVRAPISRGVGGSMTDVVVRVDKIPSEK